MRTYTGRRINPLNLRPEDVDILDIAHALSNECRYNGMCAEFYSVAQHSLYVAEQFTVTANPPLALAALLHDGSEAYLKDIPSPVKKSPEFACYREIEARVQAAVYEAFGLGPDVPAEVKAADHAVLVAEGIVLMNELYTDFGPPADVQIAPMQPEWAKAKFMAKFQEILAESARFLVVNV